MGEDALLERPGRVEDEELDEGGIREEEEEEEEDGSIGSAEVRDTLEFELWWFRRGRVA